MHVAFLHPDLGIGGAERLVVDAALSLRERGHTFEVWTCHHDPTRCFAETLDGASFPVHVYGDFLPRHLFGRLHVVFATIRMLYLTMCFLITHSALLRGVRGFRRGVIARLGVGERGQGEQHCDVQAVFCDAVSVSIPVLRLCGHRVFFYCHFPDFLLSSGAQFGDEHSRRQTRLKRLYRAPFDWLERWTTAMANVIVVNSHFTKDVLRDAMPNIDVAGSVDVLYPPVDTAAFREPLDSDRKSSVLRELLPNLQFPKKNVALAIQALAEVRKLVREEGGDGCDDVKLVLAGGYDPRLPDNVSCLDELQKLADKLHVANQVIYLKNVSSVQKRVLLDRCLAVLYTPANEHFGIVPVEAMAASRPVIALRSGGPMESVVDGRTGFLVDHSQSEVSAEGMAHAMRTLLDQPGLAVEMGLAARDHASRTFSRSEFGQLLERYLENMC